MARIIPERPRGRAPKAMLAFYRTLKGLPDEFTVWMSLGNEERPQVFVLWRERHAFVIEVAETTQALAERAIQTDFLAGDEVLTPETFGRGERGRLDGWLQRTGDELGPLAGPLPVRKLVVFPNVSEGTVDEVLRLRGDDGVSYLGLQQCGAADFARHLERMAEAALPEPLLVELRKRYTPESVVPAEFVVRGRIDRNTKAGLGSAFLDFDQEWCVKNDLDLKLEQSATVREEETRTKLVTGVAGSGKSLVLLYRALLAAKLHPGARVLVLTHNKPLRHELVRRAGRLETIAARLECRTFFQWAAAKLGDFGGRPLSPTHTAEILELLRERRPALERFSTDYLTDEIGWIKDQRLVKKDDYLAADRVGRGTMMTAGQRDELWEMFREYQKRLQKHGLTDWHNVALRFHREAVVDGRFGFPVYDAIFVDEAQFFAKAWFEVVRAALKPGGHLFLAADPTQGFLRRRQSWISAGIEVRGRTTRLNRAYRNTRAILGYALRFYEGRRGEGEVEDGLNVPDEEQLAAVPDMGEPPVEITVANVQDEMARVVNEVVKLREEGLRPGSLVVLDADSAREGRLREVLAGRLGGSAVWNLKDGPMPEGAFCGVSTLNAATGLEAPVVMLLGMSKLLGKEEDPRLSEEERVELRRDHTRQLYMGFTRAGRRLVVMRVGEL